jgi:hypothetical protein
MDDWGWGEPVRFKSIKEIKDKSVLTGDQKLIQKHDWIPASDMDSDGKILAHPLFDTTFERILEDYKPIHKTAFVSLCTVTRPYYYSRKWKKFIESFGDFADMIVGSNGGVIPRDYWNSYPFLNYDGFHDPKVDEEYKAKFGYRLEKFLRTHSYEYVIANFRPNQRNTPVIEELLPRLKADDIIKDYVIIPNEELYNDVKCRGFPAGSCFPDLDDKVLNELTAVAKKFAGK